jgi:ubiquinone biosynthesis protein
LVTIEGMGRTLIKDFDMLQYALEFAEEIVKNKYDPQRIMKDLARVGRDSTSLLYNLPRQLKQFLRKLNSQDFAVDININQVDDLKRSIETNGNLNYLGLVVGSLIIASTMILNAGRGPDIYGFPVLSLVGYGFAFFLSLLAFYNYIRK